MLTSATAFRDQILTLKPTNNKLSGVTAFVNTVASFMNAVQAGSNGTPGIFTFGNAAMIAILMNQQPVKDNSWISNFADAWEAGILSGVITPGTVTNVAWTGSGNIDTNTSPSPASTIITIPAAKSLLISGLNNVNATNNPPLPLAEAIRNATLAFVFLCIGLGPPIALTPIPIPISAQ